MFQHSWWSMLFQHYTPRTQSRYLQSLKYICKTTIIYYQKRNNFSAPNIACEICCSDFDAFNFGSALSTDIQAVLATYFVHLLTISAHYCERRYVLFIHYFNYHLTIQNLNHILQTEALLLIFTVTDCSLVNALKMSDISVVGILSTRYSN